MRASFSLLFALLTSPIRADELTPLRYSHPGLTVDLGVGLWAWPVPCDADGDGDFDLIVSCPDKPSNGVWLFENATGDTAKNKFPVFMPAVKLSRTVHYVTPSYVGGKLRVLGPGAEFPAFTTKGIDERKKLPLTKSFYTPVGKQPKGPKVRHNQWRYVDYDGDGVLDLVAGIEDWSEYGWDDGYDPRGKWTHGPLHGFVFVFLCHGGGKYAVEPIRVHAAGKPVDVYGCPPPTSRTSTATATSICSAASSSTASPTLKTSVPASSRNTPPGDG